MVIKYFANNTEWGEIVNAILFRVSLTVATITTTTKKNAQ